MTENTRSASIARKKKVRKAVKLGSTRKTGVKQGTFKLKLKLSKKALRKPAGKKKRLKVSVQIAVISPSGIPTLSSKTLTIKRGR